MERKNLRIGSRKSPLALKQVEEFLELARITAIPFDAEIVPIETCGDRDLETPLANVENSDFFTREIDKALLNGTIDLAVHSAKDLPEPLPQGLRIAAITDSIDPTEALVSSDKLTLEELPRGARVGTSSRRRKEALLRFRPNLQVVDIRGTIGERLEKIERRELDALIVASAAMIRLGLEDRITQRIPEWLMPAHPHQGRLAIVVRDIDEELNQLFKPLDANHCNEIQK